MKAHKLALASKKNWINNIHSLYATLIYLHNGKGDHTITTGRLSYKISIKNVFNPQVRLLTSFDEIKCFRTNNIVSQFIRRIKLKIYAHSLNQFLSYMI